GLLDRSDLEGRPSFPSDHITYQKVSEWKLPLLKKAAANFLSRTGSEQRQEYTEFCRVQASWLEDHALFTTAKEHFTAQQPGESWNTQWDAELAFRQPAVLKQWETRQAEKIAVEKVIQYFFFSQWRDLRKYANDRGIRIIGDLPIYITHDSADVWSHPELFRLDAEGNPEVVSGVPPDYFSETGQLWGNPIYDWHTSQETNYEWWIQRFRSALELYDLIRVDHFRAFAAYWEIPAHQVTAVTGQWVKAPGISLFRALKRSLGDLPLIAEDLGIITPDVEALRDRFRLPGMRVLQFAFDNNSGKDYNAANPYLPHNYVPNTVVYTGTHDNDTTRGWYEKRTEEEKDMIRRYLARNDHHIVWELIRLALSSVARFAIIPLQDIPGLGSEARMNTPSTPEGNWTWRFNPADFTGSIARHLREMCLLYGRNVPGKSDRPSTE
ncbi:MAG TPA: 4-alpha-glucanotransferase, partial [Spirochaetia bacterium]|nr:4-alpha-glucanotransferase [Spirochaetia bacterium]